MNLHPLIWVYLGGLALRAYLVQAAFRAPSVSKCDLDAQMISCIIWPITLVIRIFGGSR
jgi:hypothetical protein